MHCNDTIGRQENQILKMAGEKRENFYKRNHKSTAMPENSQILSSKHSKKFTVKLKFSAQVNCYLRVRTKLKHFKTKRLKQFSIYRT